MNLLSFFDITGFDCGGADVLRVIKFVWQLLDIVFIMVPIGLILIIMLDFAKNVMAGKEDDMKKNLNLVIKRLIFCVALFLVDPIVNFAVDLLGEQEVDFAKCIEIAKNDDLSEYEVDYDVDDFSDVEEPDFSKDNNYTVSENNNSSSGSGTPITGSYDIKDKKNLVAIMYSTWFDMILPDKPEIISNVSNPTKNKYYFWAEPAVGFYKSSDKTIIKKHMQQLADAGIDFIIIDNTNIKPEWHTQTAWAGYVTNPLTALLDTIVEMHKNGEKAPYVVNWIYTGNEVSGGKVKFVSWNSVNYIYDEFYTKEKYKDAWVYWDGKPFIITTSTAKTDPIKPITTRSMWGLNGVSSVNWSYLEKNNNKPGKDKNGNIEQIGVSTAMQASYMSNTSSATGRKNGKTFYEQWLTAFKYHPKVVTITWWNEWGAIHLGGGRYTDLYNTEYSRDIEPMKGGHGDTYYKWMKQYIEAYKANKECPKLYN